MIANIRHRLSCACASLILLNTTLTTASAQTIEAEAEALLDRYGQTKPLRPHAYEHASGGVSVYLDTGKLTWLPTIDQPGTYVLWVRARSGYGDNHYFMADRLHLTIGARRIRFTLHRETLDYYGDGHNFGWFESEPLQLDAGKVPFEITADWEWAHVDRFLLTGDKSFAPGKGNIAESLDRVGSRLSIWTGDRYQAFNPGLQPPQSIDEPKIDWLIPRGGHDAAVVMLHNAADAPGDAHILVRLAPMKNEKNTPPQLSVHRLAVTGMRVGLLAPDALPTINPMGYLTLTPGQSAMLWLAAEVPNETPAGVYTSALVLEDQATLKSSSVPVQLEVAPVNLKPQNDLAVFSWWGYADQPKTWWNDQIEHGVNTFKFDVFHHVKFNFDESGELIESIHFDRLKPFIDAQQRTGGYLLMEWSLHVPPRRALRCIVPGAQPGAEQTYLSEAWQRAFTTLLTATVEHLVESGVPHERILQYTFDEYLGEDFIKVGKIIRGLPGDHMIFADLSTDLDTYQRVSPYVDVWCPHFKDLEAMANDGRLAFMRSGGRKVWCYDEGYTQRVDDPYEKYRHKFWRSFAYDLDGCTYWKHQGDRVGTAYYALKGDAPITSRRYEAWRAGYEDYLLLSMLRDHASGNESTAEEASHLLDQALKQVTSNPSHSHAADEQRMLILRLLSKTHEQSTTLGR